MKKPSTPDLSYIAEPLRALAVPIESLTIDPKNARKHSRRNLDAIKKSLETFGQRLPIAVQKDGRIVMAGNGRTQAAVELGWTHIAALVFDDDQQEALAFALADNRTAELGEWDWQILSEHFRSLPDLPNLAIGWEAFEIEPLLKAVWAPEVELEPLEDFTRGEKPPHAAQHGTNGAAHGETHAPAHGPAVAKAIALYRQNVATDDVTDAEALEAICSAWVSACFGDEEEE